MVSISDIKKDMEVMTSDGKSIGRVDEIENNRIKITRQGSPDNKHHYAAIGDVSRVDSAVHLTKSHAQLDAAAPVAGTAVRDGGTALAGKNLLPWILGGLVLLALLFGLSQCQRDGDGVRNDPNAIVTQRVVGAPLRDGTLAYDVDRFLAGKDGTPRTFTLDKVNFDSGTAALREDDKSDLDDLARVMAAYPDARATVVGYADARGPADVNRDLGAQRAKAVVAALASRGIDPKRIDARTGGENTPAATNTNANGRFENRRSEFVITDR